MEILKTQGLKYGYMRDSLVLKGIDAAFERGRIYAILGASGCGKTTLLSLLGGLDTPTEGVILFDGKPISDIGFERYRREDVSFVFQNYNLIPYLTAYENIVLPVRLDGKKEDKKFLKEIVNFLELDGKLSNYPSHLSGGQQQRVAIARALITKPALLLCDEPTGNLDSRTSDKVIDLLKMTSEKFHQTIVMITHNPEIAQKADRRIRIEDGRIQSDETAYETDSRVTA